MSVTHQVSNTFTTVLKLQRLQISSANETASAQGITVVNNSSTSAGYSSTANILSAGKVDFGKLYPTYEDVLAV